MGEEGDFICLNCKCARVDFPDGKWICEKFNKKCPNTFSECKEFQHFLAPSDTNKMFI